MASNAADVRLEDANRHAAVVDAIQNAASPPITGQTHSGTLLGNQREGRIVAKDY